MSFNYSKNVIHVEVCFKRSKWRLDSIGKCIEPQLRSYFEMKQQLPFNETIEIPDIDPNVKYTEEFSYVKAVFLECDNKDGNNKMFHAVSDMDQLIFHYYVPYQRITELDLFDTEAGGDSEAIPMSNHWLMPSSEFVGLWENLIYEHGLKEKLVKFALSALKFSQHNVNQNIISCNRLILLHGPPGTGKTSLCKALAQKLAIRTQCTYRHTHLIEINSHSLFSKWFSESGKLVMRLFGKIRELVIDQKNLVCVLIDEVESLAYARDSMSGQEPKDAMRVVNALLTQLDSIKEHPNVLILATSNLADTIDLAFLDRADIKQFIGLPTKSAVRRIYDSMILEMMRVGIVENESLNGDHKHEGLLNSLAVRSVGLSGRTLRKLPFLAHAVYTSNAQFDSDKKIGLSIFLDALLEALEKHNNDQELMKKLTINV